MASTLKRRPTVVLADDNVGAVNAATQLMKEEFEILAIVNDGARALEAVSVYNPDILVLDIEMPELNGFEAAQRIRELALPVSIVFMTITEDPDYARAAAQLGASYVVKRRMHPDLVRAAKEALAGGLFLSPMLGTKTQ